MDAQIDFDNGRNVEKRSKKNAENGGSSGKMNDGGPLTGSGEGFEWLAKVIPWMLAGAGTIIATLSGMIYRKQEVLIAELQVECKGLRKDIDECQEDRAGLHVKVAVLERELAFIKDRITDRP